jgi:hypothetical protein
MCTHESEQRTMQGILELIERRRHRYESHPFIQHLQDDRIPAIQRLAYAPYASHFVLTFAEMNRHYLHQGASDGLQQRVDRHANEDSTHYAWFLHDLGVLGLDEDCRFSDALRFLWSDAGRLARELGYYVVSTARDATPTLRLVAIEALEAMGNVWLEATLVASRAHPQYEQLLYFGRHHMERETGHAIGSNVEETRAMTLTPTDREAAVRTVHGLFDRMEAFNGELLRQLEDGGRDPHATLRSRLVRSPSPREE